MSQQQRKTQAERRQETSQLVLSNAMRLFGERGYNDTSLEDIAIASRVSTRPIFHYFGNKKALFAAVNTAMELRIVESMGAEAPWEAFLDLCEDPAFRQVVLVDGPNVLGRQRWEDSPVTRQARDRIGTAPGDELRAEMQVRMIMGALAEAALMIAQSEQAEELRQVAGDLGPRLVEALVVPAGVTPVP
jgi:AcrR family transcriptional regulator